MERTTASSGCLFALLIALLTAGCTREGATPAAKATATPAARIAATPVAQAPADDEDDFEEELYVDMEAEPDEGPPPLTVKWTSIVEDGTPPFTYKWDFGDGSPASSEANPSHTYEKEGEYTATLTVTDSKGLKGSEEYDVYVEVED
jgi:PKD repeat protein